MTQIIIPTWLLYTVLILSTADLIVKAFKAFNRSKKKKIVLTYKEFEDFTKVQLKDKIAHD